MMFDPKNHHELTRKISESMHRGLTTLQDDTRQHLNSALQSALSKMNLVSREEYDIQRAVLERTREKLDMLEKKVRELENSQSA